MRALWSLVPLALILACSSAPAPATCEPEADDPLLAAYLRGLAIAQYPTPQRESKQLLALVPGDPRLRFDAPDQVGWACAAPPDAQNQWSCNSWVAGYGDSNPSERFPWTALGYTYDWSPENPTGEGPSEFVAPGQTPVVLERLVPTEDFCRRAP